MATSTAPEVTREQLAAARKAVISSSLGNALEWFDVIVYATFAVVIAQNFFPDQSGYAGLVLTFATFAISYLIRPLGAMVLGSYADRRGRKAALTLTILLMTLGTAIMAFAPTAASVGAWAGLIILVSRLVQGFSAGGEFGTSTTFLVETAPHRKAYYASWQVASQGASLLLASAFGFVLTTQLSQEALYGWGWRVPFFFGLLVGPVGWYVRSHLSETEEFSATRREGSPLWTTLTVHLGRVLAAAASVGVATISVYLILYMPTFAVNNLGLPAEAGFIGGGVAGLITLLAVPSIGNLADRVGPARIMTWAAVAAIVLAWPLFYVIVNAPSILSLALVIAVLGVIMAFYFGPLPALMVSMFPTEVRGSGLSVSYNLGVTLLGGIAPLVLTWLLKITGSLYAPSVYYIAVGLLSLVGLWFARTRYGQR